LVPLPQKDLPTTVVTVPGPGPVEPTRESDSNPTTDRLLPSAEVLQNKPPPSTPTEEAGNLLTESAEDEDGNADRDVDDDIPAKANDPYSNLDGAFGNYLIDEPRPVLRGQHGDEDDLLF
jgi:AP-2 complex subunit beta-1